MSDPSLRDKPQSFCFEDWDFDPVTGVVQLHYSFPGLVEFTETIDFGSPADDLNPVRRQALYRAFDHLHLAAGVSYYKAFVPEEIILRKGPLPPDSAAFFAGLYENGLGEFAYRNGLDLHGRIHFPADTQLSVPPLPRIPLALERRTAVPVGGGKDSLVTLEMMRQAGEPVVLFAMNRSRPIQDCLRISGLPSITVDRGLDRRLLALNAAGAYNGHIPITAILSFIIVAAGLLHGFDSIAFSNERSADEGNVILAGRSVNHQYSKSFAFEESFAENLDRHIAPGMAYFSALRPLSELHIASLFARTDLYDGVFTSCNRAFRISGPKPEERWCRNCPKCRFVFLALAPFMERTRLLDIFGGNVLADPQQIDGYKALIGYEADKPWECVGALEESAAALVQLMDHPRWHTSPVLRALTPLLAPRRDALTEAWQRILTPAARHRLPTRLKEAFDAFTTAPA